MSKLVSPLAVLCGSIKASDNDDDNDMEDEVIINTSRITVQALPPNQPMQTLSALAEAICRGVAWGMELTQGSQKRKR